MRAGLQVGVHDSSRLVHGVHYLRGCATYPHRFLLHIKGRQKASKRGCSHRIGSKFRANVSQRTPERSRHTASLLVLSCSCWDPWPRASVVGFWNGSAKKGRMREDILFFRRDVRIGKVGGRNQIVPASFPPFLLWFLPHYHATTRYYATGPSSGVVGGVRERARAGEGERGRASQLSSE